MTSESWSVFCSKVEGFEVEMNSDWKVIGNIFEGHGYDRRVEAGMEWIGSDGKGGRRQEDRQVRCGGRYHCIILHSHFTVQLCIAVPCIVLN